MAKVHVVREAFGDYRRGDEITDPAVLETVLKTHKHHLNATPHDAVAPVQDKGSLAEVAQPEKAAFDKFPAK